MIFLTFHFFFLRNTLHDVFVFYTCYCNHCGQNNYKVYLQATPQMIKHLAVHYHTAKETLI